MARSDFDRRLYAVVQHAPVAMAIWRGRDLRYELANDRYCALFGNRELEGRTLAEAFPEFTKNHEVFAIFEGVYRTGKPYTNPEYSIPVLREGKLENRLFAFDLVPTRDELGHVDGLMAAVVDTTESVRARQLLEQERARAESFAGRERRARSFAEEALERSAFLVRVAALLGEGLEIEEKMQRLVEAIAPERVDYASFWTIQSELGARRIASSPRGLARTLAEEAGSEADTPDNHPIRRVRESERTLLLENLAGFRFDDPADAELVHKLGLERVLLVPIRRRGRVVAVLSVANRAQRMLDEIDVGLYEAVAQQTALALDNGRLYRETERLRRAAEEATRAKDQFLARVSHDLRNPMGSILGWATLLRMRQDDQAYVAKGLDVIERNAKAQTQLIEDLLDISRISTGKLKLELCPLPVASSIETALDAARLSATQKGVELELAIDPEVGIISADPERFRQVVWNLASNAVKFTPAGGKVSVTARRRASRLEVVVADSGRGIAPEFLPRVFEKFEQRDQGAQRSGGLGLGLAIVKHIVELHGGAIFADSEGEGRGSRFTVLFPIRAALRSSTVPSTAGPAPTALASTKILVVDDEDEAREVLTAILEQAGATVVPADSAERALELLCTQRPNALVSDIGMPGKSGYDLIRLVRALEDEELRRLPAIALTALARAADRIQALSSGFSAHVAKPVEPAELVLVVAGALGLRG